MKKGLIHVGTSGWQYKHWKAVFYPAALKQKDQFDYYQQNFQTVELNNSFYRQPSVENFQSWKELANGHFLFAVKANRYFTHLKKLNVTAQDLTAFLDRTAYFGNQLGPILFQLPPSWKINLERLEYFLQLLPAEFRCTIEFRNPTWYVPEVYELLEKHNVAFCIYDLGGHTSPLKVTAKFAYLRLHGPGAKYQGSYTEEDLGQWATFINEIAQSGRDVYVYFDNDEAAHAVFNAKLLLKILDRKSQIQPT